MKSRQTASEARLVDAVVYPVVDACIQDVNFRPEFLGIIVSPVAPQALKAELNIRMISEDSLFTMVPVALSQSSGTVARPV